MILLKLTGLDNSISAIQIDEYKEITCKQLNLSLLVTSPAASRVVVPHFLVLDKLQLNFISFGLAPFKGR